MIINIKNFTFNKIIMKIINMTNVAFVKIII